jgi:hypothetical protein
LAIVFLANVFRTAGMRAKLREFDLWLLDYCPTLQSRDETE